MQPARRSQAGFTLIELMVVVAIIALLGAFLFSTATRPHGANAQNLSEQLSTSFAYARTRAISTRRVHQVTIYNATSSGRSEQIVLVEVNDRKGMNIVPTAAYTTVEYKRIGSNAIIWSATNTIPGTGASPTQNTGLPYVLYFKPDGSVSSASTIYLTDRDGSPKKYRVVVVKATGSSYARQTW